MLTSWVDSVVPGCLFPPLPFSPGVEEILAVGRPGAPQLPAPGLTYVVGDPGGNYITQSGGWRDG